MKKESVKHRAKKQPSGFAEIKGAERLKDTVWIKTEMDVMEDED